MADDRRIWERQDYEGSGAWRAFELYLSQDPPRSIDAAYRAHRLRKGFQEDGKKRCPGLWRNWATGRQSNGTPIPGAFAWTQRARAYDDYLAERVRQDREDFYRKQAEDRRQRFLALSGQMLTKVEYALTQELEGRIDHVARALDVAVKVSRLATGEPTENIQHSGAVGVGVIPTNLEGLSDEQLRHSLGELAKIALAITGGGELPPDPGSPASEHPTG